MATPPAKITDANIGADQAFVKYQNGAPSGAIDVRDHGVVMNDSSHDDTSAFQSALDAATSGDTVWIPEGDMLLNGRVTKDASLNGVEVAGTGYTTRVVCDLSSQTSDNWPLFIRAASTSSPLQDITFRDMWFDGVKSRYSDGSGDWTNNSIGPYFGYDSDDQNNRNITVENTWMSNFTKKNNAFESADLTVRYLSTWDAGRRHGISTYQEWSSGYPVKLEYAHTTGNGVHGIDCHGYTEVRHLLSEDNEWGGKDTGATLSTYWEDVVFYSNTNLGYMFSTSPQGPVEMHNVMAQGNGRPGFNFQNDDGSSYTITLDNIKSINNSTDVGNPSIYIHEPWDISGTTVEAEGWGDSDTNTIGLDTMSNVTGSIDNYYYNDTKNNGDALNDRAGIVANSASQDVEPMPFPTNDDGSSGSGSTIDDGSGGSTTAGTIIESWEDGTIGTEWSGSTSAFGIDTTTASDGSNSLYYDGAAVNGWSHLISTSGLSDYPQQGDTFRYGIYFSSNSADAQCVLSWAAQSETWPPNGYGLRINHNPSSADDITLEKDFSAFSDTSASTTATTPVDEWLTCVVGWADDGTLTGTVYDSADTQLAQVTATDTAYTSGGLGFEANYSSDASPRLDAIRIDTSATTMHLLKNGAWEPYTIYTLQDGEWVPLRIHTLQNGEWVPLTE